MIYIKTQVIRLLRYYSPAARSIARSDWATQNITHNMTSSIIQPYGIHSTLLCFIHEKGNYISLTTRKNSKESLTTIFCTVTFHLYISFNRQLWMSRWHSHRHPQKVTSEKWYSCVQNCTEYQSHTYTTMTVTKTNVTI